MKSADDAAARVAPACSLVVRGKDQIAGAAGRAEEGGFRPEK
jgi:hypothetical protein